MQDSLDDWAETETSLALVGGSTIFCGRLRALVACTF